MDVPSQKVAVHAVSLVIGLGMLVWGILLLTQLLVVNWEAISIPGRGTSKDAGGSKTAATIPQMPQVDGFNYVTELPSMTVGRFYTFMKGGVASRIIQPPPRMDVEPNSDNPGTVEYFDHAGRHLETRRIKEKTTKEFAKMKITLEEDGYVFLKVGR